MQFEVDVEKNDKGEFVATAVAYKISVTGRSETEALAMLMDKLNQFFKAGGPDLAPRPPAAR
jgi:hypothetical protein